MKNIYLIHGWTYSLDRYQNLIEVLKKRGVEVSVLKVPGLTEPSSKIWTIDDYTDWLSKQLRTVSKPIVIGHSNGGRIALAFASKYPGRISKLILIDSAGIPNDNPSTKLKLKVLRNLAKIGKILGEESMLKKVFYRLIGASDYYKAKPNMKITMQNMLKADHDLNLSKIKVPTTIIWGRDDTITPLTSGHKLSQALDAKLEVIDYARHSPHDSHPEQVADIICGVVSEKS